MSYIYPTSPEADSRRRAGEVPVEIRMRNETVARAVEAVLLAIAPAPVRKPETMATVTDIATRQIVEHTPAVAEQASNEVGSPAAVEQARANVEAVLAGTEQPGEIYLSATPQYLDPNYMQQIEKQAA